MLAKLFENYFFKNFEYKFWSKEYKDFIVIIDKDKHFCVLNIIKDKKIFKVEFNDIFLKNINCIKLFADSLFYNIKINGKYIESYLPSTNIVYSSFEYKQVENNMLVRNMLKMIKLYEDLTKRKTNRY
jgi:hypothetical protein